MDSSYWGAQKASMLLYSIKHWGNWENKINPYYLDYQNKSDYA